MQSSEKPDPPGHLGHRRRLRERFMSGGGDALADYELLEILLICATPSRTPRTLAFSQFREVT